MYLCTINQLRLSPAAPSLEQFCSQHLFDLFGDDFPVGVSCARDVFYISSESAPVTYFTLRYHTHFSPECATALPKVTTRCACERVYDSLNIF